ncbi:MAG: hypothetical protein PUB10_04170 [Clostridiales bacterium]|nr:hypothetical protein [Clostridiales bacterium]
MLKDTIKKGVKKLAEYAEENTVGKSYPLCAYEVKVPEVLKKSQEEK